ncbi:MAG: toxin-antitoxin system HicB family antitoxin [Gemmatimonadetes bacterium]|nr:toxin-antitoxin system HicB family antitoxin [Gemmatimonadota bacterium]
MNKKNHVLTIRVPKDLKERIEKTAEKQGVSMNQFAIYAFAREIAELETTAFFQNQYAGKDKREILEAFDAVMSKQIPSQTPPDWDQLDI